jgi:hypothetical protein
MMEPNFVDYLGGLTRGWRVGCCFAYNNTPTNKKKNQKPDNPANQKATRAHPAIWTAAWLTERRSISPRAARAGLSGLSLLRRATLQTARF